MPLDQVERAYRAWPILIDRASKNSTITYGELGKALGVHHRAVRFVLAVIQDYCLEAKLPPLTILIVNASGLPGSGFIAFDLDRFEEGLEQVFSRDWDALENPFEISGPQKSYEAIVVTLSEEPDSSEEIYTRVKSRGMRQMAFRDALLRAYSRRCAFTNIGAPEALEACHIIPWSQATNGERLDVRNGLLLNSFHHKLFDCGHITITTDFKVFYYDPKEKKRIYSDLDRVFTSGLHGQNLYLPRHVNLYPLKEYIFKRHELRNWNAAELKI